MRYLAPLALVAASYALPLRFEATDSGFLCRSPRGNILIYTGRLETRTTTLRILGPNRAARIEGVGQPGRTNYIGRKVDIPTYGRARVRNIYPGIDIVYYGTRGQLESDWIVAPGAGPRRIRLELSGPVHLRANGDLDAGDAVYRRPVAKQDGREVPVRYAVHGRQVSFALGAYDHTRTLVIDPVLTYAGFPGGDSFDAATADSAGNLYVVGTSTAGVPDLDGAFRLTPAAHFVNTSLDGGQAWTAVGDPPAGCVLALAANPQNPNILLAGGSASICKSMDGGRTWRTIAGVSPPAQSSVSPQFVNVQSIAWDPKNPLNVFAAWNAGGVIKSTDGGETWTAANTGLGPNAYALSIVIDPQTPARLYLPTALGVFESEDSAATWTLSLNSLYGSVATDPVHAGVALATGSDGNIYATSDGGHAWQLRSNPQHLTMFALTGGVIYGAQPAGVFKSADGGVTWQPTAINTPYVLAIAASPFDPNTLLVARDYGLAITTDGGATLNTVFPVRNRSLRALLFLPNRTALAAFDPSTDVFVAKYAPGGEQLIFASYFGGQSDEQVSGIAVDKNGNIAVLGATYSLDFPTTPNAAYKYLPYYGYSQFASVLNAAGNALVFSTLLPTLAPSGAAFDNTGNLFVIGTASGVPPDPVFPSPGAGVVKLANDGSIAFRKLLSIGYQESGNAIALDRDGNVLAAGTTGSANFPVTPDAMQGTLKGIRNAFIAKLSPVDGTLMYSTFLGGSLNDSAVSLALDSNGNIYVLGNTTSADFPVTQGAYQTKHRSGVCSYPVQCCAGPFAGPGVASVDALDLFIAKLSPGANSILYSTYLGGDCGSTPRSIAVDRSGNAFVAAYTLSGPSTTPPAPQIPLVKPFELTPACPGTSGYYFPSFAAGINAAGSDLLFSSWFDGAGNPSVATGGNDLLYITGPGCDEAAVSGNGQFSTGGHNGYLVRIDLSGSAGTLIDSVLDAFSQQPAPVTPGGILTIVSDAIRPVEPADRGLTSALDTVLEGVRILFDGVPAPMMSVAPGEAYVIAPYEVVGRSETQIVVESPGVQSSPVFARVLGINPSFMKTVRNQDGSINAPGNPAKLGSVVTLYATGLGVTGPPSPDGALADDPPAHPVVPIGVFFGAAPADTLNVSGIPGFVNGIFQIQARIPLTAPTGAAVSVLLPNAPNPNTGVMVAIQ
jgi:uncharacterized protein (TIGR03437 family)